MRTQYLIDSCCLIEAKNSWYSFDLAPGFWKQLAEKIQSGDVLIHKAVYEEIKKSQDNLYGWLKSQSPKKKVDIRDGESMISYRQVLDHVQNCGFYKEIAAQEWAKNEVADAKLIASALTHQYVIVTRESKKGSRNINRPSKNAKIPDVAADLGVKAVTLFDMMRDLHFQL